MIIDPISGSLSGAFGSEIASDRMVKLLDWMAEGYLSVGLVLVSVVDLSSHRIP